MSEKLIKSFKFRCYPNEEVRSKLYRIIYEGVTPVWNACVLEREQAREQYKLLLDEAFTDKVYDLRRDLTEKEEKKIRREVSKKIKWPSNYSQYKHVSKTHHPEYGDFYAQMLQCTMNSVDSSEKSFRALWLKGDTKARPPRQQRVHRAITYRQYGFKVKGKGNRLWLSMVGTLKFKLHRPIEGKIKSVTITERNWKWYVSFSCEIENYSGPCRPLSASNPVISGHLRQKHALTGVADPEKVCAHNTELSCLKQARGVADPEKVCAHNDANPSVLAAHGVAEAVEIFFRPFCFLCDSDGRVFDHPGFYFREIEKLRRLSREFSAKKMGSNNRKKARRRLVNHQEHIASQRDYWLWHLAKFYASNYKQVVVNQKMWKYKIEYARTGDEAIRLCDGAYAKFIDMLKHKCKEFGTELIQRKDEQWEQQEKELKDRAETEGLRKLIRRLQRIINRPSPAHLPFLRRESKRQVTLKTYA